METAVKTRTRNTMLDVVRGLAIFLVVLGHTIQGTHGDSQALGLFYSNPVFAFIYSFHMPLFMLIAGFLFTYSAQKYDTKTLLLRRVTTTVVPFLVWPTLNEIYAIIVQKEGFIPMQYLERISIDLWFLGAVFFCTLGVIIGKRLFRDHILFHVIVLAALVILPDKLNKHLYGYMYPYFVIGYYFNKYRDTLRSRLRFDLRSGRVLLVTALLYAVLMIFWNRDRYIYLSYLSVWNSGNVLYTLFNDLYRWVVGLVGSVAVILAVGKVYDRLKDARLSALFSYLGRESLGLYILSAYILNYVLLRIGFFADWNLVAYTLVCVPISALEIAACLAVIKIVQKIKPVNFLLFGGR